MPRLTHPTLRQHHQLVKEIDMRITQGALSFLGLRESEVAEWMDSGLDEDSEEEEYEED